MASKDVHDDSDHDSMHEDGEGGSGKKGSNSVRKAQNRIAQREFRLRKQQYIRDLEARVEILSGDKEERVELTLLLVRNLLKENKDLRGMLKQMAGFIAEGLGSCLPRLGLSAAQLDAILNRSDTDTAYEAFVNLKASKEMEEKNPGVTLGEIKKKQQHKRKREDDPAGSSRKDTGGTASAMASGTNTPEPLQNVATLKTESIAATNPATMDSYSYLFPSYDPGYFRGVPTGSGAGNAPQGFDGPGGPGQGQGQGQGQLPFPYGMPPPTPDQMRMYGMNMNMNMGMGMPSPMYAPWNAAPFGDFGGFGLTVPGQGSGLTPFMAPGEPMPARSATAGVGASGTGAAASHGQTGQRDQGPPSRAPSAGASSNGDDKVRQALTAMMHSKGLADGRNMTAEEVDERVRVQKDLMEALKEDEGMQKRVEPFQLIAYHINNFRINHAYVLPSSLRPTAVQRTIPHEHAIDGVPFPSIRDRMILLRGRYDLIDAYQGLLQGLNCRGDDPLDHRNWELSGKWLVDFQILADDEVYAITNRWRQERGEAPLDRPETRQ